jgi:hypothetical protein
MTRDVKHAIVYGAFGLLLGAKIVEVIVSRPDVSLIDWWLLLIGIGAAIVHYLPTRDQAARRDDPNKTQASLPPAAEDDTLVLRDYPDPERGRADRADPRPTDGDTTDRPSH